MFTASLRTARADLRAVYTWKSWLFGWMLRVTAQVSFFALIGELLNSREHTEYLLIGTSALVVAMANMNVVASTTWERRSGTLGLLVAAPASPLPVFVGRSAQWLLDGLLTGFLALVIVSTLFGFGWSPAELTIAFLLLAMTSLSSYVFGLFLAALVLRAPGTRTLVASLGYLMLAAFCGVTVPTDFYPPPTAQLAALLPLTHAVDALRASLGDAGLVEVMRAVGLEAIVSAAWLVAALIAFARFLRDGQRTGELEFG